MGLDGETSTGWNTTEIGHADHLNNERTTAKEAENTFFY
jgi:hypothetical protein